MSKRQLTTPIIIRGGVASQLQRVDFGDRSFKEDWFQRLLFEQPNLLPVTEIDPVFENMRPIGREVQTGAGRIDLLYINANGYITLVETKLWRNPEAHRSVLSQVLDYTKELAKWSYDDLVRAIRNAGTKSAGDPLIDMVKDASEDFDEGTFIKNVRHNLRLGRFLLLIVGDGIREDVERLTDFLQSTPHLGYRLALVEIGIYKITGDKDDSMIIQPRLIAKTQEITRAVIQITGIDQANVTVSDPRNSEQNGGKRQSITEEVFFETLAKNVEPPVVDFARWVLQTAPSHDLQIGWGDAGPLIQYFDDVIGQPFTFGQLHSSGQLKCTEFLSFRCRSIGLPIEIAQDYINALIEMIPSASLLEFIKKSGTIGQRLVYGKNPRPSDAPPLALLIPVKGKWMEVIDEAVAKIRKAAEERAAAK